MTHWIVRILHHIKKLAQKNIVALKYGLLETKKYFRGLILDVYTHSSYFFSTNSM